MQVIVKNLKIICLAIFAFIYNSLLAQYPELIISEYVEGSSNNKYIEIYNGTGAPVNLANYELRLYSNGSATPSVTNVLSGTITDGSTKVYKNASAIIYGGTATTASAVGFNGDDAIALYNTSVASFADIFGNIGCDPGTNWAGTNTTVNKTLVRNATVCAGITTDPGTICPFPTLDSEWTQFNQDDISNLGSHSACFAPTTTCAGDTILLVLNAFRGSIQWQESSDSISWTNISGATSDSSSVIIDSASWYRAEVVEGTCLPVYSVIEKFIINPVPATPVATAGSGATETQITANWNASAGATFYYLDVSVDNFVTLFINNLNVGNVISYPITGLTCATTYYYRVRAANSCGTSANSGSITYATAACFVCGTDAVQDADGNWYNTVLLGTQCWLKENMRTTKYPDSTAIIKGPIANNDPNWDVGPYYCCPPANGNSTEDCAAAASLGMLYHWSTAMYGSTTAGAQGICPSGWHIPTDIEWMTLEGELGMTVVEQNNSSWRGTNEGSEMANDIGVQIGETWVAGALTGGAGFGNVNGFNAGPTGYRTNGGNYSGYRSVTYWWTSTDSAPSAWERGLSFTQTKVSRDITNKPNGKSVRCVRD